MQRVAPSLLIVARVLGILAVLAGILAWLVESTYGVAFTCFDSCSTPEQYFPRQLPFALFLLTPCAVLATLALLAFLVHCRATLQSWRAIVVVFFLVVGLIGVAALNALVQQGQATLPVDVESGLLLERPAVEWARQWALAILLVAVVWSGGLACLEWGRRWKRLDQRSNR